MTSKICSIPGCTQMLRSNNKHGICATVHLRQAMNASAEAKRTSPRRSCSIEGCTNGITVANKVGICYTTHKQEAKAADSKLNQERIRARSTAWYRANKGQALANAAAWRQENKERKAAMDAAYRAANRERVAANKAAYATANKERVAETGRAWREANRERIRADRAALYAADPSVVIGRVNAWREANPDKLYRNLHKRRVLLADLFLDDYARSRVWELDGGICHLCGEAADPDEWHLEHVIPLSDLGPDGLDNVAVSHPHCNLSKPRGAASANEETLRRALALFEFIWDEPFSGKITLIRPVRKAPCDPQNPVAARPMHG